MTTSRRLNIMEVCGTHTMAIARHGLKSVLPPGVTLLSGPGCPVCVTPSAGIDRAVALAGTRGVTLATFGDMLRVPGSGSSLEKERASGADIRVVYSPADALETAEADPSLNVVFLGVGFETTAPAVAATVVRAKKRGIANFSVLPLFKCVPPALRMLLEADDIVIDGFLLPGHVCAVTGTAPFRFVAEEFGLPGVAAGFAPEDILEAIETLRHMPDTSGPRVEIQYTAAVSPDGNPTALGLIREVFRPTDAEWRSIGTIPDSGLVFSGPYADFDAARRYRFSPVAAPEPPGCRCGDVLTGRLRPDRCPLFGRRCTPGDPVGPCMISSEGACAAEFRYAVRPPARRPRKH